MNSHNRIPFYLDDWLKKEISIKTENESNKYDTFIALCKNVKSYFENEWEREQSKPNEIQDKILQTQRKAIIGYEKEVSFFKDRIGEYLRKNNNYNFWYPKWYIDIIDAIFHENWGLAGIIQWKRLKKSTSAKIIGDRIYFMIDGKLKLMDQKITKDRLNQFKKALFLRAPEKRLSDKYFEVYMLDGTRITIYDDKFAKEPVLVFRKYIIEQFTFEKQAELGTIPFDIIPMLKSMVKIGFNINFVGAVRTGKTTFLETWQSYEEPELEGIQIETDPEIPLHKLMPQAPIIQLVADGEELKKIMKSILRSDADYIIMAEARDGIALNIAVKAANKGTRRVKSTFHTTDVGDFCYDAASEIVSEFGGDIHIVMAKVAKSYHYLFEFIQLKNKSIKRLKGIYEIRYQPVSRNISVHQICKYNFVKDNWTFKYDIGKDKEEIACQENIEAYKKFRWELIKLAEKYPMKQNNIILSSYFNDTLNEKGKIVNS